MTTSTEFAVISSQSRRSATSIGGSIVRSCCSAQLSCPVLVLGDLLYPSSPSTTVQRCVRMLPLTCFDPFVFTIEISFPFFIYQGPLALL